LITKKIIRQFNLRPGTIVRHFKGNLYLIITIGEDVKTNNKFVVYKALYGKGKVWIKDLGSFIEEVPKDKVNPIGQVYRFEIFEPKKEEISRFID